MLYLDERGHVCRQGSERKMGNTCLPALVHCGREKAKRTWGVRRTGTDILALGCGSGSRHSWLPSYLTLVFSSLHLIVFKILLCVFVIRCKSPWDE